MVLQAGSAAFCASEDGLINPLLSGVPISGTYFQKITEQKLSEKTFVSHCILLEEEPMHEFYTIFDDLNCLIDRQQKFELHQTLIFHNLQKNDRNSFI